MELTTSRDPVAMELDLAAIEQAALANNAELMAARMSEDAAGMAPRMPSTAASRS